MKLFRSSSLIIGIVVIGFFPGIFGRETKPGKMAESFRPPQTENPRILFLVAKNFGLNYFLNESDLELAGLDLITAGVTPQVEPCPGIYEPLRMKPMTVDLDVRAVGDIRTFDAVLIAPGAGDYTPVPDAFGDLIKSRETLRLLADAVTFDIPLMAVCSGTRVLAAADIIRGRKIKAPPRFEAEITAAGASFISKFERHPPLVDGNIITASNDLSFHFLNSETLIFEMEKRLSPKGKPEKGRALWSSPFEDKSLAWGATYGASSSEGGRAVAETEDGGLIVAGYTFSRGNGNSDMLLLKTDSRGNLLWAKTYGGAGFEYANSCGLAEDGYLIIGYTTSFGEGGRDVYVVKTDFDGNEVWSKTYGGPANDVGRAVGRMEDGFVIAGYTASLGNGGEDIYLIRIDFHGLEIWSRTLGQEYSDIGTDVSVGRDGEIMVCGTRSFAREEENKQGLKILRPSKKHYLAKITADGNSVWENTYENERKRGYGFNWAKRMTPTRDGGAALVGDTDATSIMSIDFIKVDAEGKKAGWSRAWGETDFYNYGNAVVEIGDGHYLVGGAFRVVNETSDILFTEISSGLVLRKTIISRPKSDWVEAMIRAKDESIVAVGQTNSSGQGAFDVLLMKLK